MLSHKACSFANLLMLNDSDLPGVLLQAYEISNQTPLMPKVCLITEDISDEAQFALSLIFARRVLTDKTIIPHAGYPKDRIGLFPWLKSRH